MAFTRDSSPDSSSEHTFPDKPQELNEANLTRDVRIDQLVYDFDPLETAQLENDAPQCLRQLMLLAEFQIETYQAGSNPEPVQERAMQSLHRSGYVKGIPKLIIEMPALILSNLGIDHVLIVKNACLALVDYYGHVPSVRNEYEFAVHDLDRIVLGARMIVMQNLLEASRTMEQNSTS